MTERASRSRGLFDRHRDPGSRTVTARQSNAPIESLQNLDRLRLDLIFHTDNYQGNVVP
jgi:hypothetical protein